MSPQSRAWAQLGGPQLPARSPVGKARRLPRGIGRLLHSRVRRQGALLLLRHHHLRADARHRPNASGSFHPGLLGVGRSKAEVCSRLASNGRGGLPAGTNGRLHLLGSRPATRRPARRKLLARRCRGPDHGLRDRQGWTRDEDGRVRAVRRRRPLRILRAAVRSPGRPAVRRDPGAGQKGGGLPLQRRGRGFRRSSRTAHVDFGHFSLLGNRFDVLPSLADGRPRLRGLPRSPPHPVQVFRLPATLSRAAAPASSRGQEGRQQRGRRVSQAAGQR